MTPFLSFLQEAPLVSNPYVAAIEVVGLLSYSSIGGQRRDNEIDLLHP